MKGDAFFELISSKPQLANLHPKMAAFFKAYLANEKVVPFNNQYVINTHFPPYPGKSFDRLLEHFNLTGDVSERRLYSVTLAVTNRCNYHCWHCYNAGRAQSDVPLSILQGLIGELQKLGTVHVTLTGGEPLLRKDLEQIAGSFDDRTHLTLNTTGDGLTNDRAQSLRDNGVFAVGVSLDSTQAAEYDRLRGRKGAFETSLNALQILSRNGLYPYIIAVATHDFLIPEKFWCFMQFASEAGAREVHLLEPSATGRLAGRSDVLLREADLRLLTRYQAEVAQNEQMPALSSFAYLESPHAFGCGAGITHLYIDGSGEVCPCNLVPISFGSITREPIQGILNRMGVHFQNPRTHCVGKTLSNHIRSKKLPIPMESSKRLCNRHLPKKHPIPRFFQVQAEAKDSIGTEELRTAYNKIYHEYDRFWLEKAGKPIEELVSRLQLKGEETVLETGCGNGYATVMIANQLNNPENITAVDISKNMLDEAHRRALSKGISNIRYVVGDALAYLDSADHLDLIFSSWVLGYIPLDPFFTGAGRALKQGGRLAFIVHKEDSPHEMYEIFKELIAKDPSVLKKHIAFDFPQDTGCVKMNLDAANLTIDYIAEGKIVFQFDKAESVLEHLLKSGAGTVYYDALEPSRRKTVEMEFVNKLVERYNDAEKYDVVHEYISCIAKKPCMSLSASSGHSSV